MLAEIQRLADADVLTRRFPKNIRHHYNPFGRSKILIDSNDITDLAVYSAAFEGSSLRIVDVPFKELDIDFPTMFDIYKSVNFNFNYQNEISTLAGEASKKLNGEYDLFIGVPTRKEGKTSRAIAAIKNNCEQYGLRPAFFVYHNFSIPENEIVTQDLENVANQENVFLWSEQVPPVPDMGNVRGKAADVAMQYAQDHSYEKMIYASADADTTRIIGSFYRDAVTNIKKGVLVAIGQAVSDPATLSANKNLAFKHLIDQAFEQAGVLIVKNTFPV